MHATRYRNRKESEVKLEQVAIKHINKQDGSQRFVVITVEWLACWTDIIMSQARPNSAGCACCGACFAKSLAHQFVAAIAWF
jgi:hypothetical protein